jgi:hypothetical protein
MLIRTTITLAVLAFSFPAFAQSGQRGNTPPGMSTDGSAPADGAIKGGSSIAPGESGGMPSSSKQAIPSAAERLLRCQELKGTLGDECLQDERSAAGGSSAPSEKQKEKDNMGANGEEPGATVK